MPWFPASRSRRKSGPKTLNDVADDLRIVRVHVAAGSSLMSTMNTEQAHNRYAIERVADEVGALRAELREATKAIALRHEAILAAMQEV